MRPWILAAVLVALPLAGCAAPDTTPTPPGGTAEDGATTGPPSWAFTDIDGVTHTNGTAAGTPSVLFFFATWCSDCKRTTGELADVHADYGERASFYSISFDPSESERDFASWKERYDQPWPHGLDPDRAIQRTFGVRSQSTVIVLDADGYVVGGWGWGQADAAKVRGALERASA